MFPNGSQAARRRFVIHTRRTFVIHITGATTTSNSTVLANTNTVPIPILSPVKTAYQPVINAVDTAAMKREAFPHGKRSRPRRQILGYRSGEGYFPSRLLDGS